MKAFVPAAGLGTRLKPFTLSHPKALVKVGGVPMLARVLERLKSEGFDDIVVNIHHFGGQIIDFLNLNGYTEIAISDERGELLDTGGALLKSKKLFDNECFLVHNVDILSNASLNGLMETHKSSGADMTLLVSQRDSSRQLLFNQDGYLVGWHHIVENNYKPANYLPCDADMHYAFSGIYVCSPSIFGEMARQGRSGKFSIIDFMLDGLNDLKIKSHVDHNLQLIDIGKPESLEKANSLFD